MGGTPLFYLVNSQHCRCTQPSGQSGMWGRPVLQGLCSCPPPSSHLGPVGTCAGHSLVSHRINPIRRPSAGRSAACPARATGHSRATLCTCWLPSLLPEKATGHSSGCVRFSFLSSSHRWTAGPTLLIQSAMASVNSTSWKPLVGSAALTWL